MKRALSVLFNVLAVCAILVLSSPGPARASAGDYFTIYNEGYHTIYTVNVEPTNYGSWGPDLLGSGYVLYPGHSFQPLSWYYGSDPYIPSCYQDVRVIYADGTVMYDWDVNICAYNVTFYY